MKKLILGLALMLPLAFATPSSAMVGQPSGQMIQDAFGNPSLIEVKGGRGHGCGHGMGRGHGRSHGWSRGRKVGWRGRGCPPGLRMQGRC